MTSESWMNFNDTGCLKWFSLFMFSLILCRTRVLVHRCEDEVTSDLTKQSTRSTFQSAGSILF